MGAPFHLHPFDDVEPVDAPLDLIAYPHGDELDQRHPMRIERHSPFWAAFVEHMRDRRARVDVALAGLAALGFAWIAIRVAATLIVGRH